MNEQELEKSEINLLQKLNDPGTSLPDLVEMIEENKELKEKVVDVANSALFGTSRKVTSLKQAILLIGFRNVRRILTHGDESAPPEKEQGAGA